MSWQKAAAGGVDCFTQLHTLRFVLELCIHSFSEQLVITCHSVYVPSNSEIELTDPQLVDMLS